MIIEILIGLGLLAWVLRLLQQRQPPQAKSSETASAPVPYTLKQSLLTPTELRFYQVLREAAQAAGADLKIGLTITAKVRLADVLKCPPNDRASFQRISQKHLDFILCDATTLRPLVAVELDDRSHQRSDRQKRDQFVDRALAAARLPILHIPVESHYNVTALASQIRQAMTQGRD